MVTGVGIDIVEVDRVAEKINRGQGFRELVFSASEIEYCESATHKFEHYAARFAAKEAFFKAIGTGWTNGTAFNEIEVVRHQSGKPQLVLSGTTALTLQHLHGTSIELSLSHTKAMATAIVIIQTT